MSGNSDVGGNKETGRLVKMRYMQIDNILKSDRFVT